MNNLRKIVFLCQMSMVSTDSWSFWEVSDTMTETELEDLGQELAQQNAEMYGYYSYPDQDLEDLEEDDSYDDTIGAVMYDYEPEKHDMHRVGNDTSWNRA